jgi:hypothetical protein
MPVAGPDSIAGLRCKLGVAEPEVIKSRGTKGKARVTFAVDPRVGAQAAAVCGERNGWSADADVCSPSLRMSMTATFRVAT